MVQLKGELCYLTRKHKKRSKNVDFKDFFNVKKPENWPKSLPSQILVILAFA